MGGGGTATPAGGRLNEPVDVLDPGPAGGLAIRGGALRMLGYGAGLLLAAVSIPFMIRHLGVADFGRYVLITALVSLVGGVTEVGVQAVGTREYSARGGRDCDRLMSNLLGVRLAMSLIGLIAAIGFALAAGYDRALVLGAALAGFGSLVQGVQGLLVVPLVARLRLGWTTVVELVRQSVTVATTLGLVLVGATLLPFFAVSIAGAVVSLVLTVALVRGLMPLRPRFDPREWWRLLRDTVAIAVAIAVNMTYFRIAIVIMSLLATELETGYFATSFRVVEVLLPIPGLVMAGVFPILSRAALGDSERLAYVLRRVLDVALIAGCGLVLGLEVGAPLLIDVLAGDAGKPAVEVLRIQAPALLATFLAAGCGLTLFALHRNRAILVANVAALGLAAGLTWALVPSLGAQGAALAMLVGEWALALAVLVPVVRSMPELELSLGIVVPPLVAVGLAASVLLAPLPVALQTPLALGVYVAVLFRLRAVPPELTRALAPRRPSRAS